MKDVLKAVFQLIGFVLLLPLLYAGVFAFRNEVLSISLIKQLALYRGALIFLGIYLFIYNFKEVFDFTIQGMSKIFSFTGALAANIGYILPTYSFIAMMVYVVLIMLEKLSGLEGLFISILGFLLTMHWVLTAKTMYDSDGSLLKANYFFFYALLLLVHLVIGALLLNWIMSEFSSWSFCKNSYNLAQVNYMNIYHFLFVDGIR